ncbi:macrolide 2'-phosphotransferase [Solwaraspora sp. WMMA2065]|uniref:macrolide 2'-phosphotransferase n=1 Tax=Solwaraspora sp. WMMA2065 TaxID=3015166 RepID=UPI00259B3011|nr:macrolide 2'-phosphotransferase [Solwaraspora sp. WMMA2065]WJK33085.1 macrolide 2'-phosphotransferase [Solwaraspora sp. WMMA2065]
MAEPEHTVEHILELARARGLHLFGDVARLDDTGWDFVVVHAYADDGQQWILRAPRRPDVADAIATEGRLLELLRDRFTVAIPRWMIADQELVAYRRLAGEPAASEDTTTFALHWRIDRADPPASYVERLGEFMAQLHSMDVREAQATGLPVRRLEDVRSAFAERLAIGVSEFDMHHTWHERGLRWLHDDRLWAQRPVLIHGDLHPGHTLVDDSGALAGILDWTDAEIGDPGQEFVEAARKFDPPMLAQLLESYRRHGGPLWPGLSQHAVEAIAFAPLALGVLGLRSGKQRYVDAARARLGVPSA